MSDSQTLITESQALQPLTNNQSLNFDRPLVDVVAEFEDRATTSFSPEELKERAVKNFYFFASFVLDFPHIQRKPHMELCQLLQGLGTDYRSLRVTMPRGALKTTVSSKAYPLWLTARNPNLSVLIAANTHDNACKMVREIRQHWEGNPRLRGLFPECVPNTRNAKWTDECASLRRTCTQGEGTYEAAGVATSLPSRHYHVIVCDDLVRAQIDNATGDEYQPDSKDIEKAILFVKMMDGLWVMSKERTELHIGTRWAVHDLISWLHDTERCERTFEIKAISDQGQPTYPFKYDLPELARLRKSLGDYMFETQYMNAPRALSDQVFNEEHICYYTSLPRDEKGQTIPLAIGMTVDPASSKKSRADFTAMIILGIDPRTDNWYVLETVREKMSPSETVVKVVALFQRWNPSVIGIETVGYQEALREALMLHSKEHDLHLPISRLKTPSQVTKEQRIRGLQPRFMRNNVDEPSHTMGGIFLKKGMYDLGRELAEFPDSRHDDLIDALAYARQLYPSRPVAQEDEDEDYLTLGWFMNKGLKARDKRRRLRP